ncbi:uncharacterized protein LOC120263180 [Dioscorea cayenensis subsp. rotundata]|uniref:Uncharacterized protein LOC120263180 n=1 Tax=Dioscorea cayennensis subsp. rotundata TaxID=55577 RepID=A0AB40BKA5_DIOCR|nr:uncharacterized protein LOC120263180 [Dioscorea cayenensis subsp. rotundata]
MSAHDFKADDDNVNFNLDLLKVGDGVGGGGVSLAGTWWDKKALSIAEEVSIRFLFFLLAWADIRAFFFRISKHALDEVELLWSCTRVNISLEVSSPGVERVVRIPEDLDRFKDRPMYVKYTTDGDQESDGIFRLISFDLDLCNCTWGIADVKKNRHQAGKGRPLNNKQREWRLQTSFDSLRIVRLHSSH